MIDSYMKQGYPLNEIAQEKKRGKIGGLDGK